MAIPLIGLVYLLPAWDPANLYLGLFRERQPMEGTFAGPAAFREANIGRFKIPTIFYTDDPIASVTVQKFTPPGG